MTVAAPRSRRRPLLWAMRIVFGTILLPVGIAVLMGISIFFSTSGFEGDEQASGSIVVVNQSDIAIEPFETEDDGSTARTATLCP